MPTQIKVSIAEDLLWISGVNYPLKPLRDHLLRHYPGLCLQHCLGIRLCQGVPKWTFNWDKIYDEARNRRIINLYILTHAHTT